MTKKGVNHSSSSSGELSDRIPGIRRVFITESFPDPEGAVIGLIYLDPRTRKVRPVLYSNGVPDDYKVVLSVRFRRPYHVGGLAQWVFDYVKDRIPRLDTIEQYPENSAVYIISGPNYREDRVGPSVWIRPKSGRSVRSSNIEVVCDHEDAVRVLSAYAKNELGRPIKKVIRKLLPGR